MRGLYFLYCFLHSSLSTHLRQQCSIGEFKILSVSFDLGLCLKANVFWCAGGRLFLLELDFAVFAPWGILERFLLALKLVERSRNDLFQLDCFRRIVAGLVIIGCWAIWNIFYSYSLCFWWWWSTYQAHNLSWISSHVSRSTWWIQLNYIAYHFCVSWPWQESFDIRNYGLVNCSSQKSPHLLSLHNQRW